MATLGSLSPELDSSPPSGRHAHHQPMDYFASQEQFGAGHRFRKGTLGILHVYANSGLFEVEDAGHVETEGAADRNQRSNGEDESKKGDGGDIA